jgi:hypothetical protein
MPEMIVALLMLINGEIKEARIQPTFGKCMERGRIAKRDLKLLGKTNIKYQCIKSMAELEDNIDGSKSIKKLIIE